MLLSNLSLILEGGGMRGMFSAGVFDAFLEKNWFSRISPGYRREPAIYFRICRGKRAAQGGLLKIMWAMTVTAA